jgi:hypothetical protein
LVAWLVILDGGENGGGASGPFVDLALKDGAVAG